MCWKGGQGRGDAKEDGGVQQVGGKIRAGIANDLGPLSFEAGTIPYDVTDVGCGLSAVFALVVGETKLCGVSTVPSGSLLDYAQQAVIILGYSFV